MISSRSLSVSLALILVILLFVSPAFGQFGCCIKHTQRKFKVSQVGMFEGYYHQDSAGVCDMDAVVFTVNTRPCGEAKRTSFCADPTQKWVKDMISAVKKLAKKSKRHQERKRQKLCKPMKKTRV